MFFKLSSSFYILHGCVCVWRRIYYFEYKKRQMTHIRHHAWHHGVACIPSCIARTGFLLLFFSIVKKLILYQVTNDERHVFRSQETRLFFMSLILAFYDGRFRFGIQCCSFCGSSRQVINIFLALNFFLCQL